MNPKITSSTKSGPIKAPANGQPTMAPTPNHMMHCAVFFGLLFQSRKDANPNMDVHMVKLEGKKEADA